MKEYLLKMSKWCFVFAMLVGVLACSDDDSINTNLYSGTNISSYATIKADKESKKTSIEILKEGECMAGKIVILFFLMNLCYKEIRRERQN